MKNELSRRLFLQRLAYYTGTVPCLASCVLQQDTANATGVPITTGEFPAEKLAQLLLVGFRGVTMATASDFVTELHTYPFGGIILFDEDVEQSGPRNIQSAAQVQNLVGGLQAISAVPLLVAIDCEGGNVNRFSRIKRFPNMPSHQELGRRDDSVATYNYATAMAKSLVSLGINWNLAPVVDVNVNPRNPIIGARQRSFSADPRVIARQAEAFIRAHRAQGVLTALKHFPGHGSTKVDSHLELPEVTHTWSAKELQPYRDLLGTVPIDAIMTAHLYNRVLDAEFPATLSPRTIGGLLRGKSVELAKFGQSQLSGMALNYNGLVISDDLQMHAITRHFSLKMALYKAMMAGVDMMILGNNTGRYVERLGSRAVQALQELVREGKLSVVQLEQAYQRVQVLKRAVGIL